MIGDKTIEEQLQWLARGPSITVLTFQGYKINGYTLYTKAQDEKSTNQNSSVPIDAIIDDNGELETYYGVIQEIWELQYGPLKIPLLKCQWVKNTAGGVVTDKYGMAIVDLNKIGYKDEPFVLANDVTQVFYLKDMSSIPQIKMADGKKITNNEPKRHIVLPGKWWRIRREGVCTHNCDYM
jgi:hypothetical protein